MNTLTLCTVPVPVHRLCACRTFQLVKVCSYNCQDPLCVHDKMLFCLTVLPDHSDDLFDVKSELIPVSANWKNIGIALRLSPDTLDRIQAGNSGDPIACLTSMVTEWLKRNYNVKGFGEPTWQKLVEAVGHPAGRANKALAREIARRHQAGGKLRHLSRMQVVTIQINLLLGVLSCKLENQPLP